MIDALPFILLGATLGLSAASLPGPLMTLLITETLNHGWKKSFKIVFAPLVSDIVIVPAVLLILKQVPAGYLKFIHFAGAALLFYMAFNLRKSLYDQTLQDQPGEKKIAGFKMAVLLNFVSPGPYLFWSLVNGPNFLQALEISIFSAVSYVAAFYSVFILGMLLIVAVFNSARSLGPKLVRSMIFASIFILLFFAVKLVVQGLSF